MNGIHALAFALLAALSPLRADDALAQDAVSMPAPITDPALVAQRYSEIAARPEYHESPDVGLNPRLEEMLSEWFQHLGKRMGDFRYTSRMPAFESLLMSVLVVFSLAILGYILYRLTRGRTLTWSEAEPPAPGQKTLRSPEFYDEEIAQAINARDWHAAWLAAWRQFLSRLERRNLVEADRTRTNREYLGQLRKRPLPATALTLVTGMVDAYDRCIYGRAAINESEWASFHRQLEEAALLLHLDDKRSHTQATEAGT